MLCFLRVAASSNMLVDRAGRDAARNLLISWAAIRSPLRSTSLKAY